MNEFASDAGAPARRDAETMGPDAGGRDSKPSGPGGVADAARMPVCVVSSGFAVDCTRLQTDLAASRSACLRPQVSVRPATGCNRLWDQSPL